MNSRNGFWRRLRLDAPSNAVCEIIIYNINIDESCNVGVRNVGSANKKFLLGPKKFASRVLSIDNDSTIEAYYEGKSDVKYFLSRSYNPKMAKCAMT